MPRLTEFELHVLATRPAGSCELILNEEHFTRIVRDGMAKAEISLDIMTADFKAMLVPLRKAKLPGRGRNRRPNSADSIVHLFQKLADKGVEIRILHAGTPSGPALQELKKALAPDKEGRGRTNLTIRRCPRLHAKAVIIDQRAMYLGSANLTGAGMGAKSPDRRNFEIGLWTEASALLEGVSEQFNRLWEGICCKKCGRKEICPVPLEEPQL